MERNKYNIETYKRATVEEWENLNGLKMYAVLYNADKSLKKPAYVLFNLYGTKKEAEDVCSVLSFNYWQDAICHIMEVSAMDKKIDITCDITAFLEELRDFCEERGLILRKDIEERLEAYISDVKSETVSDSMTYKVDITIRGFMTVNRKGEN